MKKRIYSIIFILFLSLFFISCKGDEYVISSRNGQVSLTTKAKSGFEVVENNAKSYLSSSTNIDLYFETFNLNQNNENKLVINNHEISLDPHSGEKNMYKANNITILGANVKDGKLILEFKTGSNKYQMIDRYSIKNVYIMIGEYTIWSNEYTKENYFNSSLNIGSGDLETDYRFNYVNSRKFTFEIPDEYLDAQAVLLEDNLERYTLKIGDETKVFENDAYLDVSINISDNETIFESRKLEIIKSPSVKECIISMDGLEINENFNFSNKSWSPGNHTVEIYAANDKGFILNKKIHFNLSEISDFSTNLKYKIYDIGAQNTLSNGIDKLGVEVTTEVYQTVFSSLPSLTFEIEETDETKVMWEGVVPTNRTAFMQVYNPSTKNYETVSTTVCNTDGQIIKLGFEREKTSSYVTNGKIYVRVGNINLNSIKNIVANIYHVTDVQYITEKASTDEGGYIQQEAASALTAIADYLIQNKENSYTVMTGDFVQSKSGAVAEWKAVMKYLMNPILEAGVSLGVSSGNHDVGGLKENSVNGSNALDDELYYDYFNENLGPDIFENTEYYQNGFEGNRSHWDKINLNGHEFIILYLGWGSSKTGIYVSEKDIKFAKEVLDNNQNTDVILATHCYMGPKNDKNNTGNYVFDELVKPYKNIKLVLSGHVNGTSMMVDLIDDNNDGSYDRQVLQLLTDFQEEDNTYGASFIRNIGLDFDNNQMIFTLYSPFFNDTEIEVMQNPDIVKNNLCFTYDYDLNNIGYGMKSYGLK